MSKAKNQLLELALSATAKNITKSKGGSGRTTYLDRFVNNLLDENGQPTEPKKRTRVIAEISLEICLEQRADQIAAGEDVGEFILTPEGDTEDDILFIAVNKKVKNQVASAVANNNNATSVSYNEKYKDVWQVVKEGSNVSLAPYSSQEEE